MPLRYLWYEGFGKARFTTHSKQWITKIRRDEPKEHHLQSILTSSSAWERRDHAGIRATERAAIDLWLATLKDLPGIRASVIPDPTNNPLDRLQVEVERESGFSAASLAAAL